MKKILITSVSGRVGQPVLRTLYNLRYNDLLIYGADANCLETGMPYCEKVFKVPKGSDPHYATTLLSLCRNEGIDAVLPTHDTEVYALSQNLKKFEGIELLVSSSDTIETCFDKFLTHEFCKQHNIPFAEAFLPSTYNDEFEETIVKLRKGFAWQGIERNPPNAKAFSDEFMVQKLYKGVEVSCPFYVNKNGELVDFITIVEKYDANSRVCIVKNEYRETLRTVVETLSNVLSVKGVLEIECIIDSAGKPHLIELNARFSNTTNVRAAFGFTDVEWIVSEYLYNNIPSSKTIKEGYSVRVFNDLIFENA